MNEFLVLIAIVLAGALLGAIFFGGLWWTVQKGMRSENPALWFLGSLVVRTALVLPGFYWVSQGHWTRLAASLFGFLIARVIVVKLLAPMITDVRRELESETGNAS